VVVQVVSFPFPEHSVYADPGEVRFQQPSPSIVPFTYVSRHDNGEAALTETVAYATTAGIGVH